MEFIKFIAPYLPYVVVAYILIECRYVLLLLYLVVKKKIAGWVAHAPIDGKHSAATEAAPAPAPVAVGVNHACQNLLQAPALSIFSVCLSNEEKEFDDEKSRARFDSESVNDTFSELLGDE
ncbi:MAG: hypothetical protein LBF55_05070 [Prevotellaceae bacterium]|jgi:hypothetical protein|nr:hypothetical protein [Prevotellaceae bacterium]